VKPEVDQILFITTSQLMNVVVPQLPAGYLQGTTSVLGVMTLLAAQEYDRAADIRFAENADMRALFKEAAPGVADAELRGELLAAADLHESSLRISALNEVNYALRRLLIRLQAQAEEMGMHELERRIWIVLKASAERRQLQLAPA